MTAMRTPTLAQVLEVIIDQRLEGVHTAMPGSVESYDATRQTADVRLLLKARTTIETGDVIDESLPVAVNVPVVFPGAGGFRLTFPVKPGDGVLVVFAEASIDRWQARGGEQATDDVRRFHLADAIAIPGLRAVPEAWQGASSVSLTLGHNTGPGIVLTETGVELGARDGSPATEAAMHGTYFIAQLQTLHAAASAAATASAAAHTANAALAALLPTVTGPLALTATPPQVAAVAAAAAAVGTTSATAVAAESALAAAIAAFNAAAAAPPAFLSPAVRVK